MSRELRLLTIPEILRMAQGSVDFPQFRGGIDWSEMFEGKVSHGHFDSLVDEIQTNGFGMPIVLCDRQDGRGYVIGNGHHRLCAAILLGLWRIPVMVSEGSSRDDFMCGEDSADDYGRPIPHNGRSEYWDMMCDHLPYGFMPADAELPENLGMLNPADAEDGAFWCDDCGTNYRISDACCMECHNEADHREVCMSCGNVLSQCSCGLCDACGYRICICADMSLAIFRGDSWAYFRCNDCGMHGYPREHRACGIERDHGDALDEDYAWEAERAMLVSVGAAEEWNPRPGAWHPEAILSDAYGDHAAWLADEPLRQARMRKESLLESLRSAVMSGASEYVLEYWAQELAAAVDAYAAL